MMGTAKLIHDVRLGSKPDVRGMSDANRRADNGKLCSLIV